MPDGAPIESLSLNGEGVNGVLISALGDDIDTDTVRTILKENFSFEEMQRGYVAAITGDMPSAPEVSPESTSTVRYTIAPWCMPRSPWVYNDYEYQWTRRDKLAEFLTIGEHHVLGERVGGRRFTLEVAMEFGVTPDEVTRGLQDGIIIRV